MGRSTYTRRGFIVSVHVHTWGRGQICAIFGAHVLRNDPSDKSNMYLTFSGVFDGASILVSKTRCLLLFSWMSTPNSCTLFSFDDVRPLLEGNNTKIFCPISIGLLHAFWSYH